MNWKPISEVPTDGYRKELLLYCPSGVHKWKIGHAFPIDEDCNRYRIMFIVGMAFLQSYEEPTHWAELTSPID